MRASYASKLVCRDGVQQTKRYCYYASTKSQPDDEVPVESLPAQEIEHVVLSALADKLSDHVWVADQARAHIQDAALIADALRVAAALSQTEYGNGEADAKQNLLSLIIRITVRAEKLQVTMNLAAMLRADTTVEPIPANFGIPFKRCQNGRAKPIVIAPHNTANPDPELIALIVDARRWASELMDGAAYSVKQITDREGLRSGVVSRILPLAWLAPDLSTSILEGRQPGI